MENAELFTEQEQNALRLLVLVSSFFFLISKTISSGGLHLHIKIDFEKSIL